MSGGSNNNTYRNTVCSWGWKQHTDIYIFKIFDGPHFVVQINVKNIFSSITIFLLYKQLYKKVKVKVKWSRYRHGVAQRVPGNLGSQISWQRHRMVVRLSDLRTGRLYPQEIFLVLISVRGWVDPRAILCQWKIPLTPAEIEPATFRFVAQHLNHCATAVPT